MVEASNKLSDARVHLDSFGGGAPLGCVRTHCGVLLGDHNPRVTQKSAEVTCSACLAQVAA